jgi:hypothetical protein
MPTHVRFLLAVQLAVATCVAADPFYLVGVVTNTTNEEQQQTAAAVFSFDQVGFCTLVVGPPLYGSGGCAVASFDRETGKLELISFGPLITIKWTGTMKDGIATGTYLAELRGVPVLPENGTFSFFFQEKVDKPPKLGDFLASETVTFGDSEFVVWLERDMLSVHHKDGTYAGRRVVLDGNGKALVVIDDSANGSVYRLADSDEPFLEWVTDGKTGYYAQRNGKTKRYLDRFFKPTGWVSFEAGSHTIFAYQDSDGIELFDGSLKPLGLRSGKTSSARVYWMATKDGVTEYLDESFKSLNWYSLQHDGRTYFATLDRKKKVKLYDANLKELRPPKKEGFWTQFARGFAMGMAAYGQALQAQQAAAQSSGYTDYASYTSLPIHSSRREQAQSSGYTDYASYGTPTYPRPRSYNRSSSAMTPTIPYNQTTTSISPSSSLSFSNTYTSTGQSYTTTTQRLGAFTYSNTYGSGGYHASSTTQHLGAFDYTSGYSSDGYFFGTTQRIGNFIFSNFTTPSGGWSGTSNQIGNFTFHNFSGPQGQHLSGTSTRIGNFIFTNIH